MNIENKVMKQKQYKKDCFGRLFFVLGRTET